MWERGLPARGSSRQSPAGSEPSTLEPGTGEVHQQTVCGLAAQRVECFLTQIGPDLFEQLCAGGACTADRIGRGFWVKAAEDSKFTLDAFHAANENRSGKLICPKTGETLRTEFVRMVPQEMHRVVARPADHLVTHPQQACVAHAAFGCRNLAIGFVRRCNDNSLVGR